MTRPPVDTIAPEIKVNGTPLPAEQLDALIDMRINLGLRLPSRARLTFLDDGFAISTDTKFGLGTKIAIADKDGEALFTGEVTGVELEVERGAPNVTVIADDAAYKMTLGNKARSFTKMTYSDIIGKIAGEYGMSFQVGSTGGSHEYVLQADSDFGFLSEICDRVGFDWWMDPQGKLQCHPMGSQQGSTPTLSWAQRSGMLHSFSVRASALHPQKVTVHGWDADATQPVKAANKSVTKSPEATLVKPYLEPSALKSVSAVQSGFRMFAKQSDGADLATSVATLAVSSAVVAEGLCEVNAAVQVGHVVQVSDVGPASGKYAVTEVEHSYTARGFLTRFVAGDRVPTGLVDSLAAAPVPSSFRQDSLVVGVVTNAGDSNSPKGHVKVKFPALGNEVESAWARVVSMGAGVSRGMTFVPEVNDEVIVGFEGGDVTRPLVLGGVYSSANTALDFGVDQGKVARRQIVSRLGHVIELGDGQGPADQRIALTLAGGEFAVDLSKEGLAAKVPAGKPISITAGEAKFEIDKQGNITIAGQKIVIKSNSSVEISGMNIALKSRAKLEGSGMELKMQGTMSADVSSGGATSVKGATVAIN